MDLHVFSKNLQSIRQQHRFDDFVCELDALDFEIGCITETWRRDFEETLQTPHGNKIFMSSCGANSRGVGICLHKQFLQNVQEVSFHACSDRVCCLRCTWNMKRLHIYSVYFPTAWDSDDAVEELYDIIDLLLENDRRLGATPLLGGDFNACLGRPLSHDDVDHLGSFGSGDRNARGWMLARWILRHNFQVMNRVCPTPAANAFAKKAPAKPRMAETSFVVASARHAQCQL